MCVSFGICHFTHQADRRIIAIWQVRRFHESNARSRHQDPRSISGGRTMGISPVILGFCRPRNGQTSDQKRLVVVQHPMTKKINKQEICDKQFKNQTSHRALQDFGFCSNINDEIDCTSSPVTQVRKVRARGGMFCLRP